MRYYIIAGERSGDLHAGNLVKAIRKLDSSAEFKGFGGDYMKEGGVAITTHYSQMAFMGFAEVVANLNKISSFLKACKQDILDYQPDVIILVDYGGFNLRIAKFAKKNGLKVFYYITPKVWAWNQKRAYSIKANVDRMFVILPFEKDFYKKFNWDVDYVGNPVLDAIKQHKPDNEFLQKYSVESTRTVVALLPGSRKQELRTAIPMMSEVVKQFPDVVFGIAAVSNLDQSLYLDMREQKNVFFVHDDTYSLLANARAAIVTSGTATLETALLKVPQVVVYKTSFISYKIAKALIRVPFISLVNLIAGKLVVKELIQEQMNSVAVSCELKNLLVDESYRDNMLQSYNHIYELLDIGSASENAAALMIKYLKGY
jgi:lipid-A-disaccharide synthase